MTCCACAVGSPMEAAAAGDTFNTSAAPHTQERKARTHKLPHPRIAPSITAYFETPGAILHHVSSSVDQSGIRMAMEGTREHPPEKFPIRSENDRRENQ